MKSNALIATDGRLTQDYAKTAHGLIRGSDRFNIIAVIDEKHRGKDAGSLLDGKARSIPVYGSLSAAIEDFGNIDCLIIGVATVGGVMSATLLELVKQAIVNGISIVNGLHELLSSRPELMDLAQRHHVDLIDIRKPKPVDELHFWTGKIYEVDVPIVAVLAMDCAMGKRTTARMMMDAAKGKGFRAEMIYTGQTGWMQGITYGFIFDSTINDFVSGELEHAIHQCWINENPDLILLEGQSSLRNPSGPCGSEMLVSGNARQVILVHAPAREFFDNDPSWGKIPSIQSEVALIEYFGSRVIGMALNTQGVSSPETWDYPSTLEKELGIPVVLPLEQGVHRLIDAISFEHNEN